MAGHKAAERAAHLAASPAATGKAAARKKADAGKSARQAWDGEEVRMLEKALTKFPQGTAKRWDQVCGLSSCCAETALSRLRQTEVGRGPTLVHCMLVLLGCMRGVSGPVQQARHTTSFQE